MELDTFIKNALVKIAAGVKDANSEIYDKYSVKKDEQNIYANSPFRLHKNLGDSSKLHPGIDFDIAVTIQEDTKSSGSGKISVLNMISAGGGVDTSDSSNTQHRIKFSVGITNDWD
jgi:hypothetical protein